MADQNNGRPFKINGLSYKEVDGEGYKYNKDTATWKKIPKDLWNFKKRAIGKEERVASAENIGKYTKSKDESARRSKASSRAKAKGQKLPSSALPKTVASTRKEIAANARARDAAKNKNTEPNKPKSTSKETPAKPKAAPAKPKATPRPQSGGVTPAQAKAKKAAADKKKPAISQSDTQWVKKGDMVNGKAVKKGYVSRKDNAEKKVTARVKLVVDTPGRGKAGDVVRVNRKKRK